MKPKRSRSLLFAGLLASSDIAAGIAGLIGTFNVPIVTPDGIDARVWSNLLVFVLWLLVFGGVLTLSAVACIKFVSALDDVKRTFPNAKRVK